MGSGFFYYYCYYCYFFPQNDPFPKAVRDNGLKNEGSELIFKEGVN